MRNYNYKNKWEKLLTPEVVSLLTQIHEYKGEQTLFIEAKADTLTQLVEIAKIQSTEASNKIEGIYNDDMSVIKNLRASDIKGNMVTLREDSGHSYDIEVSEEFAIDLKELSYIDTWERKNRYGLCKIKIEGLYSDSCFKVENRKGSSEYAYRYTYYRILRKRRHLSIK